jgi:hypothetical protein
LQFPGSIPDVLATMFFASTLILGTGQLPVRHDEHAT